MTSSSAVHFDGGVGVLIIFLSFSSSSSLLVSLSLLLLLPPLLLLLLLLLLADESVCFKHCFMSFLFRFCSSSSLSLITLFFESVGLFLCCFLTLRLKILKKFFASVFKTDLSSFVRVFKCVLKTSSLSSLSASVCFGCGSFSLIVLFVSLGLFGRSGSRDK